MSLSEVDLSPFLSDDPPVPQDVTFLVEHPHDKNKNITVRAHKLFLAAVSPVFQTNFYGSLGEPKDPVVIKDSSPEAFKSLLEYIYKPPGAELELLQHHNLDLASTITTVFMLMRLADLYMVDKLKAICEAVIVNGVIVNNDNLFGLARLGRDFSCFEVAASALLDKCAKFLKEEILKNYGILAQFEPEDVQVFKCLISRGEKMVGAQDEADYWMREGIFPLDELDVPELNPSLPTNTTARQNEVISCYSRNSPGQMDLTCFSSYDRYRHDDEDDFFPFTVTDVFKKNMVKNGGLNGESCLFYCLVPPYTRKMFGGTEHSKGFLGFLDMDIEWAGVLYVIVLRGSVSCVVSSSLARMNQGDVLRFDTINHSGIWNLNSQPAEMIIVAAEYLIKGKYNQV